MRYFIDSPVIVDNPYTYHFAGIGRDFPRYPADTSALLAAAQRNLAAFDFVGICEQFAGSAQILCQELGWPVPTTIPHENRTSSEDGIGSIDRQTMDVLRERNRLDLELYACALALFQARARAEKNRDRKPAPTEPNRLLPFPEPNTPERRATIHSVSAAWAPGEDSRVLELAVGFRTSSPIAELSLGVQVNDGAGRVVWGTSTSKENLDLHYEIDGDCRAAFFVQCELPQGRYFVTAALSEPRRLGFHDHWIDRAALFEVTPQRVGASPYVRGMMLQAEAFRSGIER